jgi:nucleoside-diphosphate-sugar epimerase
VIQLKALVTGAAGFIGKELVQTLLKTGYDVVGFDKKAADIGTDLIVGDILSFNFDEVLDDVDVVFHLAGLLGTTELFHRIIEAEKVNVIGTLNLLESMRKNGIKKFIFTSKPNTWRYNAYTITKENCERFIEMYQEIYNFKPVITKPFNVYGPDEPLEEYRKAIPYFIVAALKNEPLEIFGDGEQTMDCIYVKDVAKALVKCAEILPEEIVEIGTSEPLTVNFLAKKIIDLCGSDSEIIHKPMRKGETDPNICSNGNMERLLGLKYKTDMENGLKFTIEWYREHLDDFKEIYKFKDEDFGKIGLNIFNSNEFGEA